MPFTCNLRLYSTFPLEPGDFVVMVGAHRVHIVYPKHKVNAVLTLSLKPPGFIQPLYI